MGILQKITRVTCAIIENDGKILAAQRSQVMSMPSKWEFPGGKIEPGEEADECIVREIREEIDAEIKIIHPLPGHIFDYGSTRIELIPFICKITGGALKCKEHEKIVWEIPEKLDVLDWAEADILILKDYMKYIETKPIGTEDGYTNKY